MGVESIHPSLVAGWAVFDPFASKFVFIFSQGQIYDIRTETLSLPDSGFDNISMVSKPPSKCIQNASFSTTFGHLCGGVHDPEMSEPFDLNRNDTKLLTRSA